jgi:hypothetical protein
LFGAALFLHLSNSSAQVLLKLHRLHPKVAGPAGQLQDWAAFSVVVQAAMAMAQISAAVQAELDA